MNMTIFKNCLVDRLVSEIYKIKKLKTSTADDYGQNLAFFETIFNEEYEAAIAQESRNPIKKITYQDNVKITTTEKTETRYENIFETTDGQTYLDLYDAKHHQDFLDGTKKKCTVCSGAGHKMVDKGDWGYFEKWVQEDCKNCSGRGYLELKYA